MKGLKAIGLLLTIVGGAATILTSVVDDKKQEQRINEGIDKALEKRDVKPEVESN